MLGINNQDALSNDLDNNPFLNRLCKDLPVICIIDTDLDCSLSVRMITYKHYMQERQGKDSENIIGDLRNGTGTNQGYDQESKES